MAITDAPRAGSAEAKKNGNTIKDPSPDAPRAGSAEAKRNTLAGRDGYGRMHPVQAAPRQRTSPPITASVPPDAPRAGSAEAKRFFRLYGEVRERMHPVQAAPRQSAPAESPP